MVFSQVSLRHDTTGDGDPVLLLLLSCGAPGAAPGKAEALAQRGRRRPQQGRKGRGHQLAPTAAAAATTATATLWALVEGDKLFVCLD